tara:strand:+ start:5197 stop:5625 length:429 start_codon:yes stop_codon:yes gene_type:complete
MIPKHIQEDAIFRAAQWKGPKSPAQRPEAEITSVEKIEEPDGGFIVDMKNVHKVAVGDSISDMSNGYGPLERHWSGHYGRNYDRMVVPIDVGKTLLESAGVNASTCQLVLVGRTGIDSDDPRHTFVQLDLRDELAIIITLRY